MGAIFSKLMKQGVATDGQPTQYYDSPAAAGQALAAASARTAQPGTSTVDGTIGAPTVTSTQPGAVPEGGVGPAQDSVVTATPTQDKTTVGFSSPPVAPQPGITHPTWRDAQMSNATGGPDLMTTKGKLLNLVLNAGVGAMAGDAAAREGDPRHGYPGLGAAGMAGVNVPFLMKQKANALINEQLEQRQKEAQIENIPLNRLLLGADIQNKQSATAKNLSEVTAAGAKTQLDLAEALSKPFIKGDDGQMYLAGQDATGKPSLSPVKGIGITLPVDSDLAHSIGRDDLAGKFLPSKTVEQLKQIADAGQTITSANGRQLIVKKSTGEVIKDLGTATPIMTANIKTAGAPDARLDKSFQYNQGRLDKIRAPIDTLATRFGRLQDTLSQGTPQADSLVAPELLSVMAGGQGSGLRMNEAEIARIVGGRSKWEDLRAAVNKWQTDPKAANSITPDQRTQIRALVNTVGQKIAAKQAILSQAGDGLLDAPDVQTHRKILGDTQNKLDSVDNGGSASGAATPQGGFFAGVPGAVIRKGN